MRDEFLGMRTTICIILLITSTNGQFYNTDNKQTSSNEEAEILKFRTKIEPELVRLDSENNECFGQLNRINKEYIHQLVNQRSKSLSELDKIQLELSVNLTYLINIVDNFDVKFEFLKKRVDMKEKGNEFQQELESLKSQLELMKIAVYSIFGLFVALKVFIICKWCCCIQTQNHKVKEMEMTPGIEIIDNNKFATISGRIHSKKAQVQVVPGPMINHYSNNFINSSGQDDKSPIYDTCEYNESKKNSSADEQLYDINQDEDIYYDEFYDGLTDDIYANA